jgi:hypothetical protein
MRTHQGLLNYLDQDLCISLGCTLFIDMYVRRLTADSFVQVSVDCLNN